MAKGPKERPLPFSFHSFPLIPTLGEISVCKNVAIQDESVEAAQDAPQCGGVPEHGPQLGVVQSLNRHLVCDRVCATTE
eukprot:scaffold167585_cov19-Tisochrysis_lutea.AAC.2